jgi:hypothetical protein
MTAGDDPAVFLSPGRKYDVITYVCIDIQNPQHIN